MLKTKKFDKQIKSFNVTFDKIENNNSILKNYIMKAKNLYYVMALCAGSFAFSNVANAQDVFVDDAVSVTEFTCDNSNHYFSNWRNSWFIPKSAPVVTSPS